MPETTQQTLPRLPLAAIGLVVIGAAGPWVTLGSFSKGGLEGDGVITLVLALVAAGVLLLAHFRGRRAPVVVVGICGLLALAIAIIDIADVQDAGFGASVGWGLWLTLVGAIALLAAAAVAFAGRRRE